MIKMVVDAPIPLPLRLGDRYVCTKLELAVLLMNCLVLGGGIRICRLRKKCQEHKIH